MYLSDIGNNRIRKIDLSGNIITVAGNGVGGLSADGGMATDASLEGAQEMCVDIYGNLFIAETNAAKIRKVTPSGIISTFAGTGLAGPSGDHGPATAASLVPYALKFDDTGNMYVTGWTNYNIRKIDTSGIITTVAGNGIEGFSGDNGVATLAELSSVWGIAIDFCNNVYVADEDNYRIRKVTFDTACHITGDGSGSSLNVVVNEHDNKFAVFPNPTNNLLQIENLPTTTSYSLLTIVGATMQQGTLHHGSNTIALGTVPTGMYLLQLIDEQGNRSVSKVMKE